MASLSNTLKYQALAQAVAAGDTIKVAFYSAAASIDATTPAYTATNEQTAGAVIPAGGVALTGRTISASDGSASTAYIDFADLQLTPTVSITFQKILVYNNTRTPKYACLTHDYLTPQVWNANTTYTLTIPGDGGNGILRFN